MKKILLLALTAVILASCGGKKDDPYVPFVNPGDKTEEGGNGSGTQTVNPTVTTGTAVDITSVGALIDNNSFADAAAGSVAKRGVLYGKSADNLDKNVTLSSSTAKSGSFKAQLLSLEASTTYYYKAFITVSGTNGEENIYGQVASFTTKEAGQAGVGDNPVPGLQYLGCYEMPEISLINRKSSYSSGNETWGSTKWYNYLTTNESRMVVTHTYSYNGKQYRNWTAMIDQNKRCPLWTAYVMHKGAYPDKEVGRVGDFGKFDNNNNNLSYDPAIPRTWQSSGSTSDYNGGTGYARGHHCASEDRQACADANWQTFYYTNQSPQIQNKFNDGIWSALEAAVRSNTPSGLDTLYVVVGTLFENNNSGSSNDGGTVGRPSHFYKCVMKCSFNASGTMTAAKGCAYIFDNKAYSNNNYASSITSIDAIEQRSGFDFYANVPKALQDAAEKTATAIW